MKDKFKIPDPNDSWATVELYRWQHGCLPGDPTVPDDGMKKIDIPVALKAMGDAFTHQQNEWPAPHNIQSVLYYLAKHWK